MPIQVASFLIPRNNQTWYILEDKYLKGGLRICADVAERDAIHASSLKLRMLALMGTDNKLYQLTSVSPRVWEEFKPSGNQTNPFYTHLQTTASDVWSIQHDKNNRHFILNIYDDEGQSLLPDAVKIIDENNVEVRFLYPIAGHCVLGFDVPSSS